MRRGPYEDGHLSGCPYRTEGCSCGKWRRERAAAWALEDQIKAVLQEAAEKITTESPFDPDTHCRYCCRPIYLGGGGHKPDCYYVRLCKLMGREVVGVVQEAKEPE